jgi:hypothetical protein
VARIRTIKPEFFQDEKMAPLDPLDRFVFIGLIAMADDCGRLLDIVKVIDAFIYPVTDHTCVDSLRNLTAIGRIERGTTASGQQVIQIVNWTRHQRVDKPNNRSALPEIVATQPDTTIRGEFAGDSRGIPVEFPLRPTTNDQRPTTVDRRPDGTSTVRGWSEFELALPADYRDAVDGALRAAHDPDALRRQLVAMQEAITGGAAYSPAVIGQAIHELAVAGSRVTAAGLRAFCRRIAQGEREAATTTDAADQWTQVLKGAA